MSIKVTQSAQHFAGLKPLIHGFAFAELLGNKDATCSIFSVDGSIEGGQPTTFKVPFNAYIIVLEGEYHLADAARPGEILKLSTGDVASSVKGMTLKVSSPSKCKIFCMVLKLLGDLTFAKDAV